MLYDIIISFGAIIGPIIVPIENIAHGVSYSEFFRLRQKI